MARTDHKWLRTQINPGLISGNAVNSKKVGKTEEL